MFSERDGTVRITGNVAVEEIEALEALFCGEGHVRVDLSDCTHLHTAALQLLLARQADIVAWPEGGEWSAWLQSGIKP